MSRQQKKQTKERLPLIGTFQRQLIHLDHRLSVQLGQFPSVLPRISRDLDSDEISRGQHHEHHRREILDVVPCPAMFAITPRDNLHDFGSNCSGKSTNLQQKPANQNGEGRTKKPNRTTAIADILSASVKSSGRKTKVHESNPLDKRRKKNNNNEEHSKTKKMKKTCENMPAKFKDYEDPITKLNYADVERATGGKTIHPEVGTNGTGDESLNGKMKKKSKKKEKHQKQFNDTTNTTVVENKPTRLKPINVPVQVRKLRHNLIDTPALLPDINKVGAQDARRSNWNDCEDRFRSECEKEAECIEMEQEHWHSYQDDNELMKELKLDLSFLYKNEVTSLSKCIDISLRYSESDSLSECDYTPKLTHVKGGPCDDMIDSNLENIECDAYTDYSSDFESLSDVDFVDVESQTMTSIAYVPKWFVRNKPG